MSITFSRLSAFAKVSTPFLPMAAVPTALTHELHSDAAKERARLDFDFAITDIHMIEPYLGSGYSSSDLINDSTSKNWSRN